MRKMLMKNDASTQTDPALFEALYKRPSEKENENFKKGQDEDATENSEASQNVKATQTENSEENPSCRQNNLSSTKLNYPVKQDATTNRHQFNDLNLQHSIDENNHRNLIPNMIQGAWYDKSFPNSKMPSFRDVSIEKMKRELEERDNTMESLKSVGIFAAKTAIVSGGILGGVAIALPLAGFTASGVAAGSLAAAYQSTLGGYIASGSAFAVCQSIGAAGLSATTQAAVVGASAFGVKVQSVFSSFWNKKD